MVDVNSKKIFLMAGYPGSGKSTLAKRIASKFSCKYLSSDLVREKFFGTVHFDQVGDKTIKQQSEQVYQLMYEEAIKRLEQDKKTLIDATHLLTRKRNLVLAKLRLKSNLDDICFVIVNTPYHLIQKRMSAFKNKVYQGNETVYQAWERVYDYFKADEKKGLLSWPNIADGVETITYTEIERYL